MKRIFFLIFFLGSLFFVGNVDCECPSVLRLDGPQFIWHAFRFSDFPEPYFSNPERLTDPDYTMDNGFETTMPTTALSLLLKHNFFGGLDPYVGTQNDLIPDINNTGKDFYTFYYISDFTRPEEWAQNCEFDLHVRGANYGLRLFLNGRLVNQQRDKGMYKYHVYSLDLQEKNRLGVIVFPVDHPGNVTLGGQGGDHAIAQDVTAQFTEGWDWQIPIRDRNTGIWDAIFIHSFQAVKLGNPFVEPHLQANMRFAKISPVFNVTYSAQQSVVFQFDLFLENTTEISAGIPKVLSWSENYRFKRAGSYPHSTLYTSHPQTISDPRLWWPRGYGEQPLYRLEIRVTDESLETNLDNISVIFGIRDLVVEIDHGQSVRNNNNDIDNNNNNSSRGFVDGVEGVEGIEIDDMDFGRRGTGGLKVWCNGVPIFIRGGNWIVSDALYRDMPERHIMDIGLLASANLNMLRIWGGALGVERPSFYAECDRHGILVWMEFWITGDNNGRWGGEPDWPLDHDLFVNSAEDNILLMRNHPSLAWYVGGNEQAPPNDIDRRLKRLIKELDPRRRYVSTSLGPGLGNGKNGADGPYSIQEPASFYDPEFYEYAFNPELGNVGVPVYETMMTTFVTEEQRRPPIFLPVNVTDSDMYFIEVPNEAWTLHTYIPYSGEGVHDQIALFGLPFSLRQFCEQAQIANYVQYKSLFEGWGAGMWSRFTGMLLWKVQNPWTGLRGQLYDSNFRPDAALYGCKSGGEAVHPQLNLHSLNLEIVNILPVSYEGILGIDLFDLDGMNLYSETISVQIEESSTTIVQQAPLATTTNYFLRLSLSSTPSSSASLSPSLSPLLSSSLSSLNTYWLSGKRPPNEGQQFDDFVSFNQLKESFVKVEVKESREGGEKSWRGSWWDGEWVVIWVQEIVFTLSLDIGVQTPAFFVRLSADLPTPMNAIYSDNYITLLPGDEVSVSIIVKSFPSSSLSSSSSVLGERVDELVVEVSGWNVGDFSFTVEFSE